MRTQWQIIRARGPRQSQLILAENRVDCRHGHLQAATSEYSLVARLAVHRTVGARETHNWALHVESAGRKECEPATMDCKPTRMIASGEHGRRRLQAVTTRRQLDLFWRDNLFASNLLVDSFENAFFLLVLVLSGVVAVHELAHGNDRAQAQL